MEITNPKGAKVKSRSAQLATLAEPVGFTDPGRPAELAVTEGTTASFSVITEGTLPTFYWFKDGTEIANVVGPELTLTNVSIGDNGSQYWAVVSNRLNSLPSRKAALTVVSDPVPPRITSVQGGGRRVMVAFSEELDPTSAQLATAYSLDGGVEVQSAVLDSVGKSTVTLTKRAQAFGRVHKL